jgi:hypothetical protein
MDSKLQAILAKRRAASEMDDDPICKIDGARAESESTHSDASAPAVNAGKHKEHSSKLSGAVDNALRDVRAEQTKALG